MELGKGRKFLEMPRVTGKNRKLLSREKMEGNLPRPDALRTAHSPSPIVRKSLPSLPDREEIVQCPGSHSTLPSPAASHFYLLSRK